jgi:hypothetical protein
VASTTEPVSLDALLQFIASLVVAHFKATGRPSNGAAIADAIRAKFPEFHFNQVGHQRLSDVVRIAEQRGLVLRQRDVKHLELSPGRNSDLSPAVEVTAHYTVPSSHIRSDIWRAFVFTTRRHPTYLDLNTGQVIPIPTDDETKSAELEADDRFKRIDAIPATTQQQWMEEFIQHRDNIDSSQAPIHVDDWWVKFPAWISGIDVALEKEWNRFRTGKVVDSVRAWGSANHVPSNVLFAAQQRWPRPASNEREKSDRGAKASSEVLRRAIFASLNEMSLDELEEVAIPIRYVLRHFKPY